jgi:hypothetical protein
VNGGRSHTGELEIVSLARDLADELRPKEFVKVSAYQEDSDEDESTVGKMPPSDESDTET